MSWKSFWKGVGNFGLGLLKSIPVVGNVVSAIENVVTAGKPKNLEDSSSSGWASTLSGAIPGLVDAGTTMMVNNLSKNGDINAQKELMSYQDALQDENYERELADKKALIADDRAYNDIGSQMARAERAGVSPLAALGVSSGNSISAQAPSHGGVSGHHVANNLLATISTLKGLQMQKELNDAQVYRIRQAGKLDEQKAETEVYNTIMAKLQSETYTDETKARIREMLKRGDLAGAQRELAIAQTETEDKTRDYKIEAYELENIGKEWRNVLDKEKALYAKRNGSEMSSGMQARLASLFDFIFGSPKHLEMLIKVGQGDQSVLNGLAKAIHGVFKDEQQRDTLLKDLLDLSSVSQDERIKSLAAILARILEQG